MSKEKKQPKEPESPFAGFVVSSGGIVPTVSDDTIEDDVVAGDPDLIEDEIVVDEDAIKRGDEALKKVIEAQEKANKRKKEPSTKTPTEDDAEVEEEIEDSLEGPETSETGFKATLSALADKGILSFDEDNVDDSEDGFYKAIEETVNNRLKKKVEGYGEEAVKFLDFLEAGGNPKQYIDTVYNNVSLEDYDINSEANQKALLRHSLEMEDYTAEEAEDMITEWADNGTLEKRSKTALVRLQKLEKLQQAEMVEAQKQRDIESRNARKKYWDDFKSDLDKREDIKGFKVTPKVKEDLWKFMTAVDKKTGKTDYEKAIAENKDSALVFAYLAMKNFDISKLEKQVTTKVSSGVASLIKNYGKSSKDRISSGRTDVQPEGENHFAGFKKMI